MLDSDIAANTTISTSTNATGTLLDYSGVTFADDVELHVNGVLMRCGATSGANYDVYPAGTAASGDFACEFNLKQGDVIQQFIGGGSAGGTSRVMYHFGGPFKADGAVNSWYGHPIPGMWYTTTMGQIYGGGAMPTVGVYDLAPVAPVGMTMKEVAFWYRPGGTTVGGDCGIYKTSFSDGTSTTTEALLGSLFVIPTGGTSVNRYDLSTTFSSNNTIAAGESFSPFYRNTESGVAGGSTLYAAVTMLLEID